MDDVSNRKERSASRLRAMGITIFDDAPISTISPHFRTAREIADRAIILYVLTLRGSTLGLNNPDPMQNRRTYRALLKIVWDDEIDWPYEESDTDVGVEFLRGRDLWDAVSPQEQQFFLDPNPSSRQCINASWRDECVCVMLWALGYIEKLNDPDTHTDVRELTRILLTTTVRESNSSVVLRTRSDLLDELDFIRRCHWAIYKARERGQPSPGNIESGIVTERHNALHWLIGIREQDWDDMTLSM